MNDNKLIKFEDFSIRPFLDSNRQRIDESLISLRLMKEIDQFISLKNINQKELAENLDYSNAYISQLMTGVKKINTSFINKFEKAFKVQFDFKIKEIYECWDSPKSHHLSNTQINFTININIDSNSYTNIHNISEEIKVKEYDKLYSIKKEDEYYHVVDEVK